MTLPPAVAVIPARGGSQGVKRKNLRTVGGVPLVVRSVRAALGSARVGRVIVSSDDPEVLAVARHAGAEVHERDASTAGPDATVADVVAVVLENLNMGLILHDSATDTTDDIPLVVLQPTSPFTDGHLIDAVLAELDDGGHDSVATVTADRHAMWTKEGPVHEQSVNRQLARPTVWRETGAVQAVRSFPAEGGMLRRAPLIGDQHHLYDPAEHLADFDRYSLDVDTPEDFHVARDLATRGYITFVFTAGTDTGSGHLHRCLTLADELAHHSVRFQDKGEQSAWAIEMIQARGYDYDFRGKMGAPSLTVFDCLEHVDVTDVLAIQSMGGRVAVLECLDPAVVAAADLAVNSLYDGPVGALCGPAWEPLRPEFAVRPRAQADAQGFTDRMVEEPRVLVTFGGTDPSHLTERFAAVAQAVLAQVKGRGELRVLWPPGRSKPRAATATTSSVPVDDTAEVIRAFLPFSCWEGSVSEALAWADVAVMSAGRTVLEAAAMSCPTVAVSSHEREELHAPVPGVMWLGYHASVTDEQVGAGLRWLLEHPAEARTRAARASGSVDPAGAAVRLADLLDRLVRQGA